jgi:hypothetical protein
MKRIRILCLTSMALFVMSMAVAATASAEEPEHLPEFRKGGARLTLNIPFTIKGPEVILKDGLTSVKCKESTGAGEALKLQLTEIGKGLKVDSLSKTVTARLMYTGCKAGSIACLSAGAGAELILTAALTGWLHYVNEAKKEVGEWLKATTGAVFAEFECSSLKVKVDSIENIWEAEEKTPLASCISGRVTPVDEASEKGELNFKESEGLQEIRKFEPGEPGVKDACELKTSINETEPAKTEETSSFAITWLAGAKIEIKT